MAELWGFRGLLAALVTEHLDCPLDSPRERQNDFIDIPVW